MDSPHERAQITRHMLHAMQLTSPPAQPVSTGPSNYTQSQSPFRYLSERAEDYSEKNQTPLADISARHVHVTPSHRLPSRSPSRSSTPIPFVRQPSQPRRISSAPLLIPARTTLLLPRKRGFIERLKPWFPIILYAMTSLGFVAAITFWKSEVFQALDDLSHRLQVDPTTGYAVMFLLIFITTFPPLPLYSTFITLAGYTFGAWKAAVVTYFAALSGAVCVYLLSRTFFRESISNWLSRTTTIKRVVHAIEKRPKLLFMVRLAPYPYNVMNALLAASPTLTLKTYTVCTALSLFKVIIHTTIGASIHSFAGFHLHQPSDGAEEPPAEEASTLSRVTAVIGIALCLAIIVYLGWVARKAVDEELEDDAALNDAEEAQMLLESSDDVDLERGMAELQGEGAPRSLPIEDPSSYRGRTDR